MDRDSARDYINRQAPTFLQAAQKKGYICPTCGQGSTKGNGITKDRTGHYKCFDCGLYADVIELYGLSRGIGDYNAQLQEAAAYYGITVDHRSTAREDFTPMYQNQPKTEQYTHRHTGLYSPLQGSRRAPAGDRLPHAPGAICGDLQTL